MKLNIDPTVPGVRVPYWPKSVHLEELEIQEVKALEAMDIIETVADGPTPFVSDTVMSKKANGDWRYCVNMRPANKAIKRTYHVLPHMEGILSFCAGYRYFSVLDMNSGFHMIELAEESLYITTFNTPLGLRRFKRLFFGIFSASEIFHNLLFEKFQDLLDVLIAVDDMLVRDRTIEEHNINLEKVRQRLRDLNLSSFGASSSLAMAPRWIRRK